MVDDNQADRYILKRRLSQADDLVLLGEFAAGDLFLSDFLDQRAAQIETPENVLVFIDINMPRLNGFQTVDEMARRREDAAHLDNCIFLMCSTSADPIDMAKASEHELIKGYFVKPLSAESLAETREIYHSALSRN